MSMKRGREGFGESVDGSEQFVVVGFRRIKVGLFARVVLQCSVDASESADHGAIERLCDDEWVQQLLVLEKLQM